MRSCAVAPVPGDVSAGVRTGGAAMPHRRRRLAHLYAALHPCGPPVHPVETSSATTTTSLLEPETVDSMEWAELRHSLSQGTLVTRSLSKSVVRTLMLPSAEEPTESERIMASLPRDIGLGDTPRPLLDEATGTSTPEKLDWLRSLRDQAAAAHDYQRASYIHQLHDCLKPKPILMLQDCAPAGVEAKAEFFLNNGFVCVENALAGAALTRAQRAWADFERPSKDVWLSARQHNHGIARHSFRDAEAGYPVVARKWFGITGLTYSQPSNVNPVSKPFLELDDAFLDLVDHSDEVWQTAERVLCGPNANDLEPERLAQRGTVRCTGVGPRTYPSDADAEGYTYWHRDSARPDAWPFPTTRIIKMFLYLSDVAADGGPLGVVPGSHRLPTGPWETLRCSFKSSMTLDATFPQDAMPNHYKFVAPAGTALLFDTACWHTAMPNTSGNDRRCVIMGWRSSLDVNGPMLRTEHIAELEASGRMTPTLRKLVGADK